jgi:ABC-2 type transport system permease protein
MTILGPILMAAILIAPIYLAMNEKSVQRIEVIDDSKIFHEHPIPSTPNIKVDLSNKTLAEAKATLFETDYTAILWIPDKFGQGSNGYSIAFFYKKMPGLHVQTHIKTYIEQTIIDLKLIDNAINKDVLHNIESSSKVIVTTAKQAESGKDVETNTSLNMAIGFGGGILIYIFIFLYGVQVMRGVIEEKTNRIIEVIISSVKPFQLMMGKIVGIALVGLTQFLLWIVLTTALFTVASATLLKDVTKDYTAKQAQGEEVYKKGADMQALQAAGSAVNSPAEMIGWMEDLKKIDFTDIFLCFAFYFLAGYLLYSALFAAMGAAVDNEADTQQFMLPVTIPLIFSFGIAQAVIQDPESPVAFWFSMIPLTSPVVMMVRLPFGVPPWELALSMSLLVVGFIFTTWLAGRIYRTGILMYGKKISYRELWKWLFYKG